jgi:WhiB family redox-sensing transcriptional regulator
MNWRHQAACRDLDPELWFPVGISGPALAQASDAIAVCLDCPVIAECLTWALDALPHGVAGGMTEDERRATKRRRAERGRPGASPTRTTVGATQ